MRATIEQLNVDDNPSAVGGQLLADDGKNQLWRFGKKFANRTEFMMDDSYYGYQWDREVAGWGVPAKLALK